MQREQVHRGLFSCIPGVWNSETFIYRRRLRRHTGGLAMENWKFEDIVFLRDKDSLKLNHLKYCVLKKKRRYRRHPCFLITLGFENVCGAVPLFKEDPDMEKSNPILIFQGGFYEKGPTDFFLDFLNTWTGTPDEIRRSLEILGSQRFRKT